MYQVQLKGNNSACPSDQEVCAPYEVGDSVWVNPPLSIVSVPPTTRRDMSPALPFDEDEVRA